MHVSMDKSVSVHLKNTPTAIGNHLYIPTENKAGRKEKREGKERQTEETLSSPQALGTRAGVTALGPQQARVPRRDCPGAEGAGQAVPAVSAPGAGLPVPLCLGPRSPDPGVSSAAEPTLAPPKDGGVSGFRASWGWVPTSSLLP